MTLDELWNSPPMEPASRVASHRSGAAERYLAHSIGDRDSLAYAVRLTMHGEIKLRGWYPFTAEQVIHWKTGLIWNAAVRIHGLPVRGGDTYVNHAGASRWKAFGVIPLVNATGSDIDRAAAGRMNIESIWLPSILSREDVVWTSPDPSHAHARFTANGETAEIDYSVDGAGALTSVTMPRWGNPVDPEFRHVDFGAFVDEQKTFQGYTVPSRIRAGWFFGSPRFDDEGEFFRATIDQAIYRS